jgi:DNA-3-methyladenine glycosylase I
MQNTDNSTRCAWCGTDPLYMAYHDHEWGKPERDPHRLFELLILESFQAGLSWITILRKRDHFRAAFQGFDPAVVATWGEPEVTRLLQDPGIVRHRGKIEGTIRGAQAFLRIEAREGFSPFLWSFAPPPAPGPPACPRCPPRPRNPRRCQRRSRPRASTSSAPPSPTPSCRPPAWSTTTSPPATGADPPDRPLAFPAPRAI